MAELIHGYAHVNGIRLHYVSAGNGELILFLHGFPEFWYAWKHQLNEFGKDHRAVAVDMRGYNLSDKPSELGAYRIETLIEDINALARQLSPDAKFILVGHDWGGYVAWHFASVHPEALRKLIIINAPHPTIFARLLEFDPAQQKASEYFKFFRSAEAEETLSADGFAILSKIMGFGQKNGAPLEDKPEYMRAWSQSGAITGGLNYYRANKLESISADGGAVMVSVPTLVIWGVNDPAMVPQNLTGLENYVPHLTIQQISGASHWLAHTHSAEINRHIRSYLA